MRGVGGIMAGNRRRKLILAGVGIAVFVLGSSAADHFWRRLSGSARLISVEQVPDDPEACYRDVNDPSPLGGPNLFAAFGETKVNAQDSGGTVDIDRPPVRTLRDTAPIYSSVAVDDTHNEVF